MRKITIMATPVTLEINKRPVIASAFIEDEKPVKAIKKHLRNKCTPITRECDYEDISHFYLIKAQPKGNTNSLFIINASIAHDENHASEILQKISADFPRYDFFIKKLNENDILNNIKEAGVLYA